ncbi:MAG: sigma-54 dependent transcriptional regulator, partial [Planctomycetes bacterium]|nr:sigma-54 dependent transcriptional regulator [Planctomycetota bacterium]
GHEVGAFTGATERRTGKFEAAKSGTIFLDEIGEMSMAVQARLLRVLQDRTVTPIGGNKEVPVKARVICATNKRLEQEVAEGRFRRDLYFRLNAFPVEIPPLRTRKDDIPAFARLFLEQACVKFDKEINGLTPAALEALVQHDWPGNVRELENAIERAVLLCRGRDLDDVTLSLLPRAAPQAAASQGEGHAGDVYPLIHRGFATPDDVVSLDVVERDFIRSAVETCSGDIADTARRLGISRSTLYARMRKYGINPEAYRQARE